MMKQVFSKIILSAICFVFVSIPFVSFAATHPANPIITGGGGSPSSNSYKPITPGGMGNLGGLGGESLPGMLTWIFRTSISITILLAVLMLIVGGIEYMNSESPFMKTNGKDKIFAALGGLLIALTSILLLSTIWGGSNGLSLSIFP